MSEGVGLFSVTIESTSAILNKRVTVTVDPEADCVRVVRERGTLQRILSGTDADKVDEYPFTNVTGLYAASHFPSIELFLVTLDGKVTVLPGYYRKRDCIKVLPIADLLSTRRFGRYVRELGFYEALKYQLDYVSKEDINVKMLTTRRAAGQTFLAEYSLKFTFFGRKFSLEDKPEPIEVQNVIIPDTKEPSLFETAEWTFSDIVTKSPPPDTPTVIRSDQFRAPSSSSSATPSIAETLVLDKEDSTLPPVKEVLPSHDLSVAVDVIASDDKLTVIS